jgi:hypothetical protein
MERSASMQIEVGILDGKVAETPRRKVRKTAWRSP